jgi:PKD repeat protein
MLCLSTQIKVMKKLSFVLAASAALVLSSCSEDPSASFSADKTTVSSGDVVQFTDNSTAGYNHVWDFGDGEWSQAVNPTHIYYDEGIYNVTLQVTDKKGEKVNISTATQVTVNDTVDKYREADQAEKDRVIVLMVGTWDLDEYDVSYNGTSTSIDIGSSEGEFLADGTILQKDNQGNVSTGYYDVINEDYVYLSFVQGPSGIYEIDGTFTDSRMVLINTYRDAGLPSITTTHTLEFRK